MTAIPAETLSPILHNQIPVITTELLAQLYGTERQRVTNNFNRNKDRFVEGKHYFTAKGDTLENLKNSLRVSQNPVSPKTRSLILWTERGAARHAKMLETDQAWEVFEKLEDCYFSKKINNPENLPAPRNSALLPLVDSLDLAQLANDAATRLDKAMEFWNQKVCPELARTHEDMSVKMFFMLMDSYRPAVSLRWALLKTAGYPRA